LVGWWAGLVGGAGGWWVVQVGPHRGRLGPVRSEPVVLMAGRLRVSTERYRWRAGHVHAAKGGPLCLDGGGYGPGVKGAALRFAAFRVASR
jgi:hypothetical protein